MRKKSIPHRACFLTIRAWIQWFVFYSPLFPLYLTQLGHKFTPRYVFPLNVSHMDALSYLHGSRVRSYVVQIGAKTQADARLALSGAFMLTCNTPITHTPYWAVSPHIGDTGEHGKTWEGIGNDTGRSGEKRGEMGRNGEIGWKQPPPPIILARTGKRREDREEAGSNMGDTGTTRELYGSNTAQSGITRGNTGDFSPSRTSPYCSNYPVLSPCCSRSIPCCSRVVPVLIAQCF